MENIIRAMRKLGRKWLLVSLLTGCAVARSQGAPPYLGFDKNAYPGDAHLPALHRIFSFTGYWLNAPPGMVSNPWSGKRRAVLSAGFGFAILFNGRAEAQLRGENAAALGNADGIAAIDAAVREGFHERAILFLDQEEGGRLLPEQAAYLAAWIKAVDGSRYRAGIYCSGIPVADGPGRSITTAQDVATRFPSAALWVALDTCPPAPGCTTDQAAFRKGEAIPGGAEVWQYAQSPRRPRFTAACAATYAADGNCYAPGMSPSSETFLDLNVSNSADPSQGR